MRARQTTDDDVRLLGDGKVVGEDGSFISPLQANGLEPCEGRGVARSRAENRLEALLRFVEMALGEIEVPEGRARRLERCERLGRQRRWRRERFDRRGHRLRLGAGQLRGQISGQLGGQVGGQVGGWRRRCGEAGCGSGWGQLDAGRAGRPGGRFPVHRSGRGEFIRRCFDHVQGHDGLRLGKDDRGESENPLLREGRVDSPRGAGREERTERLLRRGIGAGQRSRARELWLERHLGQGLRGGEVEECALAHRAALHRPRRGRRRTAQGPNAGLERLDLGVVVVEQLVEFQTLTRLAGLSLGEIGLHQQLVGDELRRVARHRALENLDGGIGGIGLHQATTERNLRGEVGRVLLETGSEHMQGVRQASGAAILLRQLQEGARLRVTLPALPELVQALVRERLRQGLSPFRSPPRRPLRSIASA